MVREANRPSQEYLLLDYVQRLEKHREGRRGVHVHLSRLKPQNRREHHIRIAINTIEEFVASFEGQIFLLGNNDIIFVTKGATLPQLDEAVMRLKYLFSEDPLTMTDPDDEAGHGRFATLYNVEGQYSRFQELCERVFEEERQRQKRLQKMAEQTGDTVEDSRKPLSPQQLGKLEEFLERADLSSVFRRQAVCAMAEKGPPKPIFNELFISIIDLARTVLPEVNLAANRWLFQHLTQTLDRRVLKMLARADDSSLHSSFSINVNVGTLLAPEFLDFDNSLRMGSRGTLVVELQFLDILSDYQAYVFARDFVREKGYRICLDGISSDLMPFVDRQRLGADLVKLNASPLFDEGGDEERRQDVAGQVERCGRGRVILARCDNEAMVRTGQQMGITMFQGRFLDSVLQQISRTKNPAPPRALRGGAR
jgi:EAL domain-containing protein (putative c-di-GMP-specific phosphodiesterase class I)